MYKTRPDLSLIVTKLSQYGNHPTEEHLISIKRVLHYVQYAINYCLQFKKDPDGLFLTGYCESDWASSDESRRSTTGYKYGSAISWKSRQQPTVTLSSTETEYIGLSACTREALYLKQLCKEMDPKFVIPETIFIYEYDHGAIALVENTVHHQRTKHIDIRFHFIRNQVTNGCIEVQYLQTNEMIADCLTKPVGRTKLEYCNNVLFGNMVGKL